MSVSAVSEISKDTNSWNVKRKNAERVYAEVEDYYGKKLKKSEDVKIVSCSVKAGTACTKLIKEALSSVHPEVSSRYYGCGLTIPTKLSGKKVLDLGSGSGRDCYAISKLVGETGQVIGVDMTESQLSLARRYIDYHMKEYGYKTPNISFVKGYLENLTDAGLKEEFFDVIVSNCTICLSPDKRKLLTEAYKVLKFGGEMYFSDLYADKVVPETLHDNAEMWGEGMTSALVWTDFYKLAKEVGFTQPCLVSVSPLPICDKKYREALEDIHYVSATYRMFKLPTDEEKLNFTYKGTVPEHEDQLLFDHRTVFKCHEKKCNDFKMAAILKNSRYSEDFDFEDCSNLDENEAVCYKPVNPFEYLAQLKSENRMPSPPPCSKRK